MKPTCPRVFTVSFGAAALAALVLTFALVTASCHFFGDPEQYRPKAKETTAAIVTAAPSGGEVANATPVTLTTATEGASIYYTTDETEPTPAAALYSADNKPVITPDTFILKAIAVKEGLEDSELLQITYAIKGYPARPTAAPESETTVDGMKVYLETETPGSTIYFTLGSTDNGSVPGVSSVTQYRGPDDANPNIPVITNNRTVLKAIARNNSNGNASGVLTIIYLLPAAKPTAAVLDNTTTPAGTVPYGTTLELSSATAGAAIFYTLDGSAPHLGSSVYGPTNKPELVAGKTRLRAIAWKDGMAVSEPLQVDYTLAATNITHIVTLLDAVNGTLEAPAPLTIAMPLGAMADSEGNPIGPWAQLLNTLNTKGDYVKLDLSLCVVAQGADGEYTFGHDNYPMIVDMNQIVNIVLPDGVTSIGTAAFAYCTNLALISLPSGVTTIENAAFQGCSNLVLASLPNGVTTIGGWAFSGCSNLALTSLPNGVTTIAPYTFSGCTNIALASLPSGVTSIGYNAFQDCTNLALVSLPNGVTTIEDYTFDGCSNLALASLPNGVTTIGNDAFYDCTNLALTSLPSGVTTIGHWAFHSCTNLALTALPESVTSIGGRAFYNCDNLTLTSLPTGITSIEQGTFQGCDNLALTSLPEGVTSIGRTAFAGCINLRLTFLPEGVTSVGSSVFARCTSLEFVSLPEGFTFLNTRAFEGCTSLTRITLPDGLTNINMFAFHDCTGLSNITIHAVTPPSLADTGVFSNTHPDLKIFVPAGSVDAYKATGNWSEHADRIHPIE